MKGRTFELLRKGVRRARCELAYARLRPPKRRGEITSSQDMFAEVYARLKESGYRVVDYEVDVADYRRYLERADYQRFRYYARGTDFYFPEKSLEHYLAAEFLQLGPRDVYVDVGTAASPAPDVYRDLFGCTIFRQDLELPEGIHGEEIGGDAGAMPVEDGFASKMALHCTFEHFEGDADSRFIRKAGEVLRSGGRLCILPLYLSNRYSIQSDLGLTLSDALSFDEGAEIFFARGFGQRHGRFYDVPHLTARIRKHLGDLRLTIYFVKNQNEVNPMCYVKFVALFEKP